MNNNIDLPKTPEQVSKILGEVYRNYRGVGGWILRARPYICPFEEVLTKMKWSRSVLDVGCGSGGLSMLIARSGLAERVLGIDISTKAIDVARKADGVGHCQVDFEVMGPGEYPASLFDTVVCVDVLHHVEINTQRDFLSSLCSLVEIGGQLVIKDISPLPRWKAAANTVHDILMSNQWVNYRSEDLVLGWLEEEGMKIEESCRLDRLWYGHYFISAQRIK